MFKTFIEQLDRRGGLPENDIIEIVGGPASGKTILAHQLSVAFLASVGERVFYIDVDGTFDPERAAKIAERLRVKSALARIFVSRVLQPAELAARINEVLRSADSALLVIDSITPPLKLVPREFRMDRILLVGQLLSQFVERGGTVIVTNQVRAVADVERRIEKFRVLGLPPDPWLLESIRPALGELWSEFVGTRIYVRRISRRIFLARIVFSRHLREDTFAMRFDGLMMR